MATRPVNSPSTSQNSQISEKWALGSVGSKAAHTGSLWLFQPSDPPPPHAYPLSNSTSPARPTDTQEPRSKSWAMTFDGPRMKSPGSNANSKKWSILPCFEETGWGLCLIRLTYVSSPWSECHFVILLILPDSFSTDLSRSLKLGLRVPFSLVPLIRHLAALNRSVMRAVNYSFDLFAAIPHFLFCSYTSCIL